MLCFGLKSVRTKHHESQEHLACIDRPNGRMQGNDSTDQRTDLPTKPKYQVAVMGPVGVGKTALCERAKGSPVDDEACELLEEVDDELVSLRVMDITTTFPTRYKQSNLRRPVELADGFILVYSITDRRSLAAIHQVASYIRYVKRDRDLPIVLVGNKMDVHVDRCVSQEEGRQTAFDLGVSFYETSTRLTANHATKIFHDLVRQIRCVIVRRQLDMQRDNGSELNVCSPFCGTRGLVDRISFRTRNRRKLLIQRDS